MPRSAPLDDWPKDMPELLPFLPLVCVAWSDGILSAAEIAAIRDRVAAQDWLDEDARSALADWLNPDLPPSGPCLDGAQGPPALAASRPRRR
jgi:acyl-CoA oxidase